MGPISPRLIQALKTAVSPERWHTYEIAAGFDQDRAHALYLWNASIGQSFHYPLQSVEVCMRNAIHRALVAVYGNDWCNDPACRGSMQSRQDQEIADAADRRLKMYGTSATTPQIVASLTFGFWIAILGPKYNRMIWNTHKNTVFPFLPPGTTMKEVGQTGRTIRQLRNRIFHQEPLLGGNLSGDYAAILKMISWICPDTNAWVRKNSSVPNTLRNRP